MQIWTLQKTLIAFGFISLASCHVHTPFISDTDKAKEHLAWAAEHDPSLLDSTTTIVTIPSKSASFYFTPKKDTITRPCILLSEPVTQRDTVSGISVTLSQESGGEVTAEVSTTETPVAFDCPETVQTIDGYKLRDVVWYVSLASIFGIIIGIVLALALKN